MNGLRLRLPGAGAFGTLAFSPDGKRLAAACVDHSVRFWELGTNTAPTVLRGHTGVVRGLAFRPDGQSLLSWGEDTALRQWHIPTGRPLEVCRGHNQRVIVAAYSADSQWIVSGSLKVLIGHTYHLSEAAQAHRDLESRATAGKLILVTQNA